MKLSARKRRIAIFAGIALMSLMLSACPYAVSKHPLSQPGDQKNDERLLGVWYQKTEDGEVYIHVAKTNAGRMEGVMIEHKFTGIRGLGMEVCRGFTTQLDQQRFLNISQCANILSTASEYGIKKVSEEATPYLIVLYELNSAGELIFNGISSDYVKASIEAGNLAGTTEGDFNITASTPDLVKFIKESDPEKLYYKPRNENKLIFRKLFIPPTSD